MAFTITTLDDLRIPGHPNTKLTLDGQPLQIISNPPGTETDFPKANTPLPSTLTPALGISTVLYNWCPSALLAFLDTPTWLSMTWNLQISATSRLEISRIRNQISFGLLDDTGHWKILISYLIATDSEGGKWIPDPEESMLGDENVGDLSRIEGMARSFVRDLVVKRRWETGRNLRHGFWLDWEGSGADPFADGLAICPRWVYSGLDLGRCTACGDGEGEVGRRLRRCGRCGTAAYCGDQCQKRDWAVHKAVCTMDSETRGKALHLSREGGLVVLARGGGLGGSGKVEGG